MLYIRGIQCVHFSFCIYLVSYALISHFTDVKGHVVTYTHTHYQVSNSLFLSTALSINSTHPTLENSPLSIILSLSHVTPSFSTSQHTHFLSLPTLLSCIILIRTV